MNNKKLGNDFEQELCEMFADRGFWAHFMSPNNSGAQPCDIIIAKSGTAFLVDAKTCKDKYFNISRLEDNQISAFEKWIDCGNTQPYVAVKHNEFIYLITYEILKKIKRINLEELKPWEKSKY